MEIFVTSARCLPDTTKWCLKSLSVIEKKALLPKPPIVTLPLTINH